MCSAEGRPLTDHSLRGRFVEGPQGLFLPLEYAHGDQVEAPISALAVEEHEPDGYRRRDFLKLGGRLLALLTVVGTAASVEGYRQADQASARDLGEQQLERRRRFLLGPMQQAEVLPPVSHLDPDGVTMSPVPADLPTYPLEKSLVDQLASTFFEGAILNLSPQAPAPRSRSLLHLGSQRSNARVACVFGDANAPREFIRLDVDDAGRTLDAAIRWNLSWDPDVTLRRLQAGAEWDYNPCIILDSHTGSRAFEYERVGEWDMPVCDILLITVVRGLDADWQIYLFGGHGLGTSAVRDLIDGTGDALIEEIERRAGAAPLFQAMMQVAPSGRIDQRSLEVWTA